MPLHGQRERVPGQLDGFDAAVAGPRRHRQPFAEAGDRLVVVVGRFEHGGAGDLRQGTARDDLHGDTAVHAGCGSVTGVAEDVGQVLVETAAEVDVEDLHAAADPEERQAAVEGGGDQRELGLVAEVAHVAGLGMRGFAVVGRVDVTTAGDDEAVEYVHKGARRAGRREQNGLPAGRRHAVHIGLREETGGHVPRREAGALDIAGDADDRALHSGVT